MNPDNLGLATFLKRIDATKGNLAILPVQARCAQEIDKAFAAMSRERIGAVVMPQDSFFVQQKNQIVGLAARNRLPLVTQFRSYLEAGGLVSYGPDIADQWR